MNQSVSQLSNIPYFVEHRLKIWNLYKHNSYNDPKSNNSDLKYKNE